MSKRLFIAADITLICGSGTSPDPQDPMLHSQGISIPRSYMIFRVFAGSKFQRFGGLLVHPYRLIAASMVSKSNFIVKAPSRYARS